MLCKVYKQKDLTTKNLDEQEVGGKPRRQGSGFICTGLV